MFQSTPTIFCGSYDRKQRSNTYWIISHNIYSHLMGKH